MLWATILKNTLIYANSHPNHEGSMVLQHQAKSAGQTLAKFLDSIDIRNVGQLRQILPEAFPTKMRGRTELIVGMNIHGAWTVKVPKVERQNHQQRAKYARQPMEARP